MREQRWPVTAALVSLVLLLLMGTFAPTPIDGAPQHPPFSLAILRRDGKLLPFATYDGRWRNHWPTPGEGRMSIPIRLDEIPRDREILVVCASGMRSLRSAQFLHAVGYERVTNLDGGTNGWLAVHRPAGAPSPA